MDINEKLTERALIAVSEKIRGAFAILTGDFYELADRGEDFVKPARIESEVENELREIFLSLKDILQNDIKSDARTDYQTKCLDLRRKITGIGFQLAAMESIINKYSFILNRRLVIGKHGKMSKNDNYGSAVASLNRISKIIHEKTHYDMPALMSKTVSSIPLRIAKSKYYDYVEKSLETLFAPLTENEIMCFKNFCRIYFNLDSQDEKSFCFADLAAEIKALDKYAVYAERDSVMPPDTRDGFYTDIDRANSNLRSVRDYLTTLYEIASFLMIIIFYGADFDLVTESDFTARDFYYLYRENRDGALDIDASVSDRLDECMYLAMERIIDSADDLLKISKKIDLKKVNEANCSLLDVYGTITNMFYEALPQPGNLLSKASSFKEQNEHPKRQATKEYAGESIRRIIQTIQNAAASSPTIEKLTRQCFLEYIPCMFSNDELMQYILNAVNNSSNDEIAVLTYCLDLISAEDDSLQKHNADL